MANMGLSAADMAMLFSPEERRAMESASGSDSEGPFVTITSPLFRDDRFKGLALSFKGGRVTLDDFEYRFQQKILGNKRSDKSSWRLNNLAQIFSRYSQIPQWSLIPRSCSPWLAAL